MNHNFQDIEVIKLDELVNKFPSLWRNRYQKYWGDQKYWRDEDKILEQTRTIYLQLLELEKQEKLTKENILAIASEYNAAKLLSLVCDVCEQEVDKVIELSLPNSSACVCKSCLIKMVGEL